MTDESVPVLVRVANARLLTTPSSAALGPLVGANEPDPDNVRLDPGRLFQVPKVGNRTLPVMVAAPALLNVRCRAASPMVVVPLATVVPVPAMAEPFHVRFPA